MFSRISGKRDDGDDDFYLYLRKKGKRGELITG
jgi:hypothetical protein